MAAKPPLPESITKKVGAGYEQWKKDFLFGKRRTLYPQTLQYVIVKYCEENVLRIVDAMMGIRNRGFNEVEIVAPREGSPKPVAHVLLDEYMEVLKKQFLSRLPKEFKLSDREKQHLRKEFRQHVLSHLEDKVRGLAEKYADKIVERELPELIHDDDHVTMTEAALEDGA